MQKPSTAVEYLAAHLSKIHGLDWHPDNEYTLATSSQDNSVRVSVVFEFLLGSRKDSGADPLLLLLLKFWEVLCHWQDLDLYCLVSGHLVC